MPDPAEKLAAGLNGDRRRHLHAVLISSAGHLVLERYYSGPDETWDRQLGHVTFGLETLHDLRSVTKSVVSTPIVIWFSRTFRAVRLVLEPWLIPGLKMIKKRKIIKENDGCCSWLCASIRQLD